MEKKGQLFKDARSTDHDIGTAILTGYKCTDGVIAVTIRRSSVLHVVLQVVVGRRCQRSNV